MANNYFTYLPITPNTVARASDINVRFLGIQTAFDLLPSPLYLSDDRVTYAADTGAANAYVVAPVIPITAYREGTRIRLKAANSNTGASTVNVSGLGVKQIVRPDGAALQVGDIVTGQILDLTYDGTAFRTTTYQANLANKLTVADNSIDWGPGAKRLADGDALSAGNLSVEGTFTFSASPSPSIGYAEWSLAGAVGGGFVGGLTMGGSNRLLMGRWGTVPAWEFDTAPYVGNSPVLTAATGASAFQQVISFGVSRTLADSDNKALLRYTGGAGQAVTLNATPTAGFNADLANRGSAAITISVPSGAYLNGAGATATSISLAVSGRVTLRHEGAGKWTVDGTGAT